MFCRPIDWTTGNSANGSWIITTSSAKRSYVIPSKLRALVTNLTGLKDL